MWWRGNGDKGGGLAEQVVEVYAPLEVVERWAQVALEQVVWRGGGVGGEVWRKPGGTVVVSGFWRSEKMEDSWMRATCWLLLIRDRGEAEDGWRSAWVLAGASALAVEEDAGMGTLEGSHARVSAMHLAWVLAIYTQ